MFSDNVLVTGSRGLIGGYVKKNLGKRCLEIPPWLDLKNKYDLENFIKNLSFTKIIHLAGTSSVSKPDFEHMNNNVLATHNILSAIKNTKPGFKFSFVYASSCAVFDKATSEFINEKSKPNPQSPYGLSKMLCEYLVEHSDMLTGYSIVRLAANVGFPANHGLLPDLVKKVKSDSPMLSLLTNSCKPYTYAGDTANFLINQVDMQSINKRKLIYSSNQSLLVSDVANIVMDYFGIKKPIVFSNQSWDGDIAHVNNRCNYFKCNFPLPPHNSTEAIQLALKDYETI